MNQDFSLGARPTWTLADMYPNLFMNASPPSAQTFSAPVPHAGVQSSHVLLGIVVLLVALRVAWELAK